MGLPPYHSSSGSSSNVDTLVPREWYFQRVGNVCLGIPSSWRLEGPNSQSQK